MQKKTLLLSVFFGCAIMQASESQEDNPVDNLQLYEQQDIAFKSKLKTLFEELFGKNEDIIALYKIELPEGYKQALVDELSGIEKAIEKKFNQNKTINEDDEKNKKIYFDDSEVGYWSMPASIDSIKGYIQAQWAQLKTDQDHINIHNQDLFKGYKQTFESMIIPLLKEKLKQKHYMMATIELEALQVCGKDENCLRKKNVCWQEMIKSDHLSNMYNDVYDSILAEINKEDLPLNKEQMIAIVMTNNGTKDLFKQCQEAEDQVKTKLHDLLFPEQK